MAISSEQARVIGLASSRKGIPNVITKDIKAKFKLLIEDNLEGLQADLDAMEPVQRFEALMRLSKYVIPTLQAVQVKADVKQFKPVIINLGEGDKPEDEHRS